MSDDQIPSEENVFEPSNRKKTMRDGASSADEDALYKLQRAIRKIKRESRQNATVEQLVNLVGVSAEEIRRLVRIYLPDYVFSTSATAPSEKLQAIPPRSSSYSPYGFKAGQSVVCKVLAKEHGGYAVIFPKVNGRGFLPTEAKLKIGEEILAQYVCFHNGRVLMSARISGTSIAPSKRQEPTYSDLATKWREANGQESTVVKFGSLRMKRATDLIMPPIDNRQHNKMRIAQADDLLWLITDLEGGSRTGCIKASCPELKSRSALLLFKGRAVGCVYGNKALKKSHPTESSLQLMLSDCKLPGAEMEMYALPDEVTLAMAALFIGYPVERSDDLDAETYFEYISSWFLQKASIACVSFTLPSTQSTMLALICYGKYFGTYHVDDCEFSPNLQYLISKLRKNRDAKAEAFILSPELTSASVRLGFSLSMNIPEFT